MELLLAAMDPNAETPSWVPALAFAIPALIVLAVVVPALRQRRRHKSSRAHQRGSRQEADTTLGSSAAIADPAEYSTDALLRAMAVAEGIALKLPPLARRRIGPAWKVPYGLGRGDEPHRSD